MEICTECVLVNLPAVPLFAPILGGGPPSLFSLSIQWLPPSVVPSSIRWSPAISPIIPVALCHKKRSLHLTYLTWFWYKIAKNIHEKVDRYEQNKQWMFQSQRIGIILTISPISVWTVSTTSVVSLVWRSTSSSTPSISVFFLHFPLK